MEEAGDSAPAGPAVELSLDLAELFTAKRVEVVQEIDVGKLQLALQAIVDAVNAPPPQSADGSPTREQFDSLHKEMEALKESNERKESKIKELQDQQESILEKLQEKVGKDEISPEEFSAMRQKQAAIDAMLGVKDGADQAPSGSSRLDDMTAEMEALKRAVEAAKSAAGIAAQETAAALQSASAAPGPAVEKTSNGGEPGVAVGQAPPTATTPTPDGRGVQGNSEVFSRQQQHLDRQLADQNAKLRKFVEEESGNLQRELAKRIDELEAQVREARKAQDATRKDQREATNVAEDAKSATQSAVTKLGEHDGQLAALRAAVEALNKGETVELPPPVAVSPGVDLGPLERRVAQKADSADVEELVKRLESLEQSLKAASDSAEEAARKSGDSRMQLSDMQQALATLQGQIEELRPALSAQAVGGGTSVGATAAGPASVPAQEHVTVINNTNTTDLSDIRRELKEIQSSLNTLYEKIQESAGADEISGLAADLDALRKAVDGKASREELDALLGAGITAPKGAGVDQTSGDADSAADGLDPSSATTENIAVTVNDMKLQLNQLLGLLKVLQGRMEGKASQEDLDSLKRTHQSITEKVIRVEQKLEDHKRKVDTDTKELTNKITTIEKRLSAVEAANGGVGAGVGGLGTSAAHQVPVAENSEAVATGSGTSGPAASVPPEHGYQRAMRDIAELRSLIDSVRNAETANRVMEGLRKEVDVGMSSLHADLQAIRNMLAEKADKAEVDAILNSGASLAAPEGSSGHEPQLDESSGVTDIVPMVNDLAARVAALSTAQKVLQERLGGKVDLSALDGKADRDALLQVTAEINDKVSQDVVARLEDELSKLKAQLSVLQSAGAADLAESAPWRSGQHSNYGGQPGDLHALLDQKANHADVQALRDALASLADQTIPGAGQAVPSLPAQPLPDDKASPRQSRVSGSGRRRASASGSHDKLPSNATDVGGRMAALEKEVASLGSALEIVAHAANILAVGEAHSVTPISGRTHYPPRSGLGMAKGSLDGAASAAVVVPGGSSESKPGGTADGRGAGEGLAGGNRTDAANAAGFLASIGLASAKDGVAFGDNGIPHGAVDKLRDMHAGRIFNRKMDWFDPAWLQDLARRVGDLEGSVRSLKKSTGKSAPDSAPVRSSGGGKDYDKMIMKLGRDINDLKRKLAEVGAGGGGAGSGLSRVPDGDHAMLSSKPLLGYRCMACDRPLEKLDERPGPHIPTNQMPVNVAPYERRGIGMAVSNDLPPKPLHEPRLSSEHSSARGAKAGSDGRGPQNWYQDVHGSPAQHLPANHVGPHLPRGGWRGNETGSVVTPVRGTRPTDKLPSLSNDDTSAGAPMGLQPESKPDLPPISQS